MVPQRAAVAQLAQLVLLLTASAGETQAESVAYAIERAMQQCQHTESPVGGWEFAGWLQQKPRLEHALAAVRARQPQRQEVDFSIYYA